MTKKCSPSNTKCVTGWRNKRKNIREITHQGALQDQVLLNPNLQLEKKAVEEKTRVAELIAEGPFMNKKRDAVYVDDAEYQAEALMMEEEWQKQ